MFLTYQKFIFPDAKCEIDIIGVLLPLYFDWRKVSTTTNFLTVNYKKIFSTKNILSFETLPKVDWSRKTS